MTTFSVIIPWRNRPELRETLRANATLFDKHSAEVVIVNCGGDPEQVRALIGAQPVSPVRHILLLDAEFNRSLAINVGAHCSTGRFLFCLDADITLETDIFSEARPCLERQRCFVKVRTVREAQPDVPATLNCLKLVINRRQMIFADGRQARLIHFKGGDGSRCGSGLLLIDKAHFVQAGGFNSELKGWGFDDLDLQIRLQLVASLCLKAKGTVMHATHGDEVRDIRGGSRLANSQANMLRCFENYEQGAFLGTYQDDVQLWRDRLREVPVKAMRG